MLALLLLTLLPHTETPITHVDLIEHNHFWDVSQGRFVWSQWIFRDYDGERFTITDWRLDKGHKIERDGDKWRLTFTDGQRLRIVEAEIFKETTLDFDPELAERETTPVDKRRLLR